MRIALGLEYNGRPYCGWQSQPSGCGVQDRLEAALAAFVGTPVRVTVAGRTDTGVHAAAQIVHLDTEVQREPISWVRGVNAHLPESIRVLWAHIIPESASGDFHARFAARSRTYRYVLLNDAVDAGLLHGLVGWFHAPLDVAHMQQAAGLLLGEHDFSAFRSAECQAKTPVKHLYEASIEQRRRLVVFTFRANAFLHHMVRNIVGSLVYVGAGRLSVDGFAASMHARDRTRSAPTFAPDGLYLCGIEYDAVFGLPAFPPRHVLGVPLT